MKFLIIFLLSFYVVFAKHEQYDGYVVYEVNVKNVQETKVVNDLVNELLLDIWSYPIPGRPGQIFVSEKQKKPFQNALKAAEIEYEAKVENIRDLLEMEDRRFAASASAGHRNGSLEFGKIYTYDEATEYIESIASSYPNVVRLVDGGASVENRTIQYLQISTTNFLDENKPIIMIQSLLHAREWITLPITLYAIHKLVVDVTETDLVNNIDWIILPIANPDGYIWSHTNARFWRKNRQTGNACLGVDLNRNFDINFGQSGSSNNPCSDTFHGPGPHSEPESQVIVNIFNRYRGRLTMYADIHSFGGMILYAWGNRTLPANALVLNVAAVEMAQAIDRVKWPSLPNYRVGNVAIVLNYLAAGITSDYAQVFGIPYAYTYELPTYMGSGTNGFLVADPDFIEQISFETWEGMKAGARYILSVFRP